MSQQAIIVSGPDPQSWGVPTYTFSPQTAPLFLNNDYALKLTDTSGASYTNFMVVPNQSSGAQPSIAVFGNSDSANSSYVRMFIDTTAGTIEVGHTGTGTQRDFRVSVGTIYQALYIDSFGSMSLGDYGQGNIGLYTGVRSTFSTFGSSFYGIQIDDRMPGAANFPNFRGLDIVAPGRSGSGTTNDRRGISIANQGASWMTDAYGIYVAAQSGATGQNVPIYNSGQYAGQIITKPTVNPTSIARYLYAKADGWYDLDNAGVETKLGAGGGAPTFPLLAPDGLTTAPSYSFTNSPTAGLWSPAANQLQLKSSGNLTIYSSGGSARLGQNAANSWAVTSGHWLPSDTNLFDIGSSGFPVRNLYVGTSVLPSADNAADLGSGTNRWRDLYAARNAVIGGTSQLTGNVGIGSAPGSALLGIGGSPTSGVGQYGLFANPTFTSTATTEGEVIRAQLVTQAASFTMATGRGLHIVAPTLGAGSSMTNVQGLYAENLGKAGITNAYGIYVEAQSGAATNNISIYNLGTSRFLQYMQLGAGNWGAQGILRMQNGTSLCWRDAANTGDLLFMFDSNNRLYINAPATTFVTSVGAAGGASALPATPAGYMMTTLNGTAYRFPYYN